MPHVTRRSNACGGEAKRGRLTQQDQADTPAFEAPTVTLPKGGGAIRGIGEKFASNPVTGTASFTIPIGTTPGRSEFSPALTLGYDSGAGNGPFGFGWQLSLPTIGRRTEKRLPCYNDDDESDIFTLTEAEDLVPCLIRRGGEWSADRRQRSLAGRTYEVTRYRPRIEGLFARVERWRHAESGEIFWRSISRENVTTYYGRSEESRVADPRDPHRVLKWLVCESHDDRGNAIVYGYQREDAVGVDLSAPHERHRTGDDRCANRYLKRVRYGNRLPHRSGSDPSVNHWMFELVFDYDEGYLERRGDAGREAADQHCLISASPAAARPWPTRPDPFSTHQGGFELRTYRRCRRTLMFHNIAAPGPGGRGYEGLVRTTEFEYADLDPHENPRVEEELAHQGSTRFASFIRRIWESGYAPDESADTEAQDGGRRHYRRKSLPPLEFEYSKARIQENVLELDSASLENLPAGLDGSTYQWADLDGEGVAGLVTEQGGAWYYKPNLGGGRLGPLVRIAEKPSTASLGSRRQQLVDVTGDGQLDLVTLGDPLSGFYARKDGAWQAFRPFATVPNLRLDDPRLRFLDLNGDGHPDLLITEEDALTWYPSLGVEGYGPPQRVHHAADEQRGPRLLFADASESISFADMCGDGLADVVRVRNGEVCYWPNLGYGRFGAKVTLDNAPIFDHPDQFDQRRIRLADIDGSGANDIVYLGRDGARLYFNQSGNRLSDPRVLDSFPPVDNLANVTLVDLLANGTACLVWSSPLPGHSGSPLRYIDLMGGTKPHLLVKLVNNLGAETCLHYLPSTHFYLADKRAGRDWITRLPFPIHVLERVEIFDSVGRNRHVTRYAYHHGFYDLVEREFRGFGRIDQWDSEDLSAIGEENGSSPADNENLATDVPPVLRKTWYHTGAWFGGAHVSDFFAGLIDRRDVGEYYREPGLRDAKARALLLEDTVLPEGLSIDEEKEASRALKGSILRQEVYALDGTEREPHPFTVLEQNFTVRRVQPRANGPYAVFFTHPREAVTYNYERNPADPRLSHAATLEVDGFGNVLKSAAVGYGRRRPDGSLLPGDQAEQARDFVTLTENDVTNVVDLPDDYRAPALCELRAYDVRGVGRPDPAARLSYDDLLAVAEGASTVAPDGSFTGEVVEKRLMQQERTYFRANDLAGPLPLGELQSLALPFERRKLALTSDLIERAYAGRVTAAMLEECGYHRESDGGWWLPSGREFYSPDPGDDPARELDHALRHFFLPHRHRRPFRAGAEAPETVISYDCHDLLIEETRDPVGNRVTAGERGEGGTARLAVYGHDYRVLQPALVMDPNRNRSAVAFDALGLVVGVAVMGKPEEDPVPGDRLTERFRPDLTRAETDRLLADPGGTFALELLDEATSRYVYDVDAHWRGSAPGVGAAVGVTLARETHASDLVPGEEPRINVSLSYSDGFGREVQTKMAAEPATRHAPGDESSPPPPRWVATGWTVFNNKGDAVRHYEPFFTDTHRFERDIRVGVSLIQLYDALGRTVAAVHPNHSWEKTRFDAWHQKSWDVNDTVLIADPAADPDVGAAIGRLAREDYLPTWHALRTHPDHAAAAAGFWPDERTREAERDAAEKAAAHAESPTVDYTDALGRNFLTIVHNRTRYASGESGGNSPDDLQRSQTILDASGNPSEMIDPLGRVIARYEYDLASRRVHESTMDAGERWTLADVESRTRRAWDGRGHRSRAEYDAAGRTTESFVEIGAAEILVSRLVYGESAPDPEAANLRGQVVQTFDQAGVVTTDRYDFKGNALRATRQLVRDYRAEIDWRNAPDLLEQVHCNETRYDALNRPIELTAPDGSIIRSTYNGANLLEQIDVILAGESGGETPAWTPVVSGVDYDAKGQRTAIALGNGTSRTFDYDPATLRMTRLVTRRAHGGEEGAEAVQDLTFTYDPAGNPTRVRDDSQQSVFFRNHRVDPHCDYRYDSAYRLIEAAGREHAGQRGPPAASTWDDRGRTGLHHPGNGKAMTRYVERYGYDSAGNMVELRHRSGDSGAAGWTRRFDYEEPSLVEPDRRSNRLTAARVSGSNEIYSASGDGYDTHGNMLRFPHLSAVRWDFRDQLRMTQRQSVSETREAGAGAPAERSWYVYDFEGARVRKVTEAADGEIKDERIYLGGFEIHRVHGASAVVRETLHISDGEQRVVQVERRVEGEDPAPAQLLRYQYPSLLASIGLELDERARIISYEEYTPFGSTSYQARRERAECPKRYRFSDKERDEESGFYYHGLRYYLPWLARWSSPDPLSFVDGPNPYVYVKNNPVLNADSTGAACDPQTATCIDPTEAAPPAEEVYGPPPPPEEPAEPLVCEAPSEAEESAQGPAIAGAGDVAELSGFEGSYPGEEPEEDVTYGEEFETYESTEVEFVTEEYTETETSYAQAGVFMGRTLAVAGVTSQLDSPAPGPADVVAVGELVVGGIVALGIMALARTQTITKTRVVPRTVTRTRTRRRPITYVTYTKTNPMTGQVYSGRSRGYGTPASIVAARDAAHQSLTASGFGPAKPDNAATGTQPLATRWLDPAYQAIRGREQQLIDSHGGAVSDGGTSANAIRGVAKANPLGGVFHLQSTLRFGFRHRYTGY